MADYKELLRRAITALPENNGAARRGVYEKARSALVGQLRAINPPLPAKDITQHRLQLEDCIRQVEQEASEAVISLKQQVHDEARASAQAAAPLPAAQPTSAPVKPIVEKEPEAKPENPVQVAAPVIQKPEPPGFKMVEVTAEAPRPAAPARQPEAGSIEDIIAQAEQAGSKSEPIKFDPKPQDKPTEITAFPKTGPRPLPSIVARAEATKSGPTSPIISNGPRPIDGGRRAAVFEPRRDAGQGSIAAAQHMPVAAPRIEPRNGQAAALQQVAEPLAQLDITPSVSPAMSAVREVEIEVAPPTTDAEHAIERAIATLDREARGETATVAETRVEFPGSIPEKGPTSSLMRSEDTSEDATFTRPQPARERGGSGAVTIFLLVFVVLLAAAGGGGYWAWREGYIDLDAMFGRTQQAAITDTTTQTGAEPEIALMTADESAADATETLSGVGNTAPAAELADPAVELGSADDRLLPDTGTALTADPSLSGDPALSSDAATTIASLDPPTETATDALSLVPTDVPSTLDTTSTDERLSSGDDVAMGDAQLTEGTGATADPADIAGSQSLLLEASDDGTTGAVPFSGTVDWTKGVDELGQPTLIGKANIPARNLGVELLIRKNSDPSLPASHLMEINFEVSDTFIGGSVAQLPGVLLKNEELVQGTPLVGASARVVGNSFLFALSASAQDNASNNTLMTTRKWMDLAVIYATGKRAIITLEKDDIAAALFNEVFAAWAAPSDTASTE